MSTATLIDDRSQPSLRALIGSLLSHADLADFAIGHVRLGAIDLSAVELSRVRRCRLLLDRLDVDMLSDAADIMSNGGPLAANLALLYAFVQSGRIELRSTGALCWAPDFSILDGLPLSPATPDGSLCLIGAHYFSTPVMLDGASLTCLLASPSAIRTAHDRFNELWANGHDVLPVVADLLHAIVTR